MELEIFQVDAFTSEVFKGNPAGVCITDTELPEDAMLLIAKEMAVSETAFLSRSNMNLRWFTPEVEVKLCGHGTLSVVHILAEKGILKSGEVVTFQTLSGQLEATVSEPFIEVILPTPVLDGEPKIDLKLIESLGLSNEDVVSIANFDTKLLVEVASETVVSELTPNFDAMKSINGRGVVVTSRSNQQELDFVSRYFAPWVGVNEDPVTGSAHCALAAFWSTKLNKAKLKAYQASSRGGYIDIECLPDHRTKLKGQAVTAIRGYIRLKV